MDLGSEIRVVAGGGSGIDAATAEALADHGTIVAVNDLGTSVHGEGADLSVAEWVVRNIREPGGIATVHHGDVAAREPSRIDRDFGGGEGTWWGETCTDATPAGEGAAAIIRAQHLYFPVAIPLHRESMPPYDRPTTARAPP